MKQVLFNTLSAAQQHALLLQPETGMGYHLLGVAGQDTSQGPLTVISNGKYVTHLTDPKNTPALTDPNQLQQAMPLLQELLGGMILWNPKYAGTEALCVLNAMADGATLPVFYEWTKPGQEFVRLSAYPDDRRIEKDGAVRPGTYATVPNDLTVVPNALSAVARYALPNLLPPVYEYRIAPPAGSLVLYGTVTPNYGLCGGGVEVYFPCGLPAGSAGKGEKKLSVL